LKRRQGEPPRLAGVKTRGKGWGGVGEIKRETAVKVGDPLEGRMANLGNTGSGGKNYRRTQKKSMGGKSRLGTKGGKGIAFIHEEREEG